MAIALFTMEASLPALQKSAHPKILDEPPRHSNGPSNSRSPLEVEHMIVTTPSVPTTILSHSSYEQIRQLPTPNEVRSPEPAVDAGAATHENLEENSSPSQGVPPAPAEIPIPEPESISSVDGTSTKGKGKEIVPTTSFQVSGGSRIIPLNIDWSLSSVISTKHDTNRKVDSGEPSKQSSRPASSGGSRIEASKGSPDTVQTQAGPVVSLPIVQTPAVAESTVRYKRVSLGQTGVFGRLFGYEDKAFIAPDMLVQQTTADLWENVVHERFSAAIRDELKKRSSNTGFVTPLGFGMAGKKKTQLKPTIIVTCSTPALQKQLVQRIKKLHWIPEYGLQCMVIVELVIPTGNATAAIVGGIFGGIFGLVALLLPVLYLVIRTRRKNQNAPTQMASYLPEERTFPSGTGAKSEAPTGTWPALVETWPTPEARPGFAIEQGNYPYTGSLPPETLCGALLSRFSRSKWRTCTLGGLVKINSTIFGLTVGHQYATNELSISPAIENAANEEHDDLDLVASLPDSQFITFEPVVSEASVETFLNEPLSEEDSVTTASKSVLSIENITAFSRKHSGMGLREWPYSNRTAYRLVCPEQSSNTDWALVDFSPDSDRLSHLNFMNRALGPGKSNIVFKEDIVSGQNLTAGGVYVNAGVSDPQEGTLGQCSSSIWVGDRYLKVRQITVDRPLLPGDSGSWVTRDDRVCGHIVAAGVTLPWAYMIPMHQIFDSIKQSFGTQEVTIFGPASGETTSDGSVLVELPASLSEA